MEKYDFVVPVFGSTEGFSQSYGDIMMKWKGNTSA